MGVGRKSQRCPNEAIKLIECPRDAWQGLKALIPTDVKAQYLRALIGAGFKHIDAASFVSPKAVPQMADSEKVLEQLDPPSDVEIIGIVVNEKGAERAIATALVTTLGYPYSVSETFLRKNQNQSSEECHRILQSIKKKGDNFGLDLVGFISMAFGNPYGDPWDEDKVRQATGKITALEIRSISLADTVGVAAREIDRISSAVIFPVAWRTLSSSQGSPYGFPKAMEMKPTRSSPKLSPFFLMDCKILWHSSDD